MLWKILIFVATVALVLVVFGRGAKRGEAKVRREAKREAKQVKEAATLAPTQKRREAEDLSPCPRCGAYVADPATCDCQGSGTPSRTDLQQ